MGYLWENMEKMDIQLERRNTAEQRERAEKAEQENSNLYSILISIYQKQGMGKEEVRKQLQSETGQKESKIDELLAKYWENGTTD